MFDPLDALTPIKVVPNTVKTPELDTVTLPVAVLMLMPAPAAIALTPY